MRTGFAGCIVVEDGKGVEYMERDGIIYPLDYAGSPLNRDELIAESGRKILARMEEEREQPKALTLAMRWRMLKRSVGLC